ncbi:hypothetical protein ACX80O_04445 [Arthrobacter sp. Hz1]
MAVQLFISVQTVQDHLKSMFAKVGARSHGDFVAQLLPNRPERYATTAQRFARY